MITTSNESQSDWLESWPNRLTSRIDLVCFPGVGAGASLFKPWHKLLPGYCSLHVCQLPARENRIDEPACIDMKEAVDVVLGAFLNRCPLERPLVIFGHSMGGVFAFEFARRLAARRRMISALIVSASKPPGPGKNTVAPDREEVKRMLLAFDPDNQSIIDNAELYATLEPALIGDFQLLRRHVIARESVMEQVPVFVISGESDQAVSPRDAADWEKHLGGPVRHQVFAGGHQFPFRESQREVIAFVRNLLQRARDGQELA